MPKLKNYGPGRRVNAWITEKQMPILSQIENQSKFFQLALDNAVGIMAWAIMKERAPHAYYDTEKIEDVVGEYNEKFPLDPLTKKRYENARTDRSDEADSPRADTELW